VPLLELDDDDDDDDDEVVVELEELFRFKYHRRNFGVFQKTKIPKPLNILLKLKFMSFSVS